MTKKERIEQLERELAELRIEVNSLRMLVYSRPVQDPAPHPWYPLPPVTYISDRTSGTTQ